MLVRGQNAIQTTVATVPVTTIPVTPSTSSHPSSYPPSRTDEVTINVCDENRKVNKYFFCKRSVLITHMKYFERFLAENESSFDLDISVHCDVEIFEWLMTYIHEPTVRPVLDKSIVVSILISSEFLQMDSLVDICLQDISTRLNEIVKLPIDLSCISDRLVNRLASMTNPQILAQTRDRKDKILNKLYKRRVEIDFSRKGGGTSRTASMTSTGTGFNQSSNRAIAASLTCCRNCGMVYLECFVSELTCRKANTVVDYRGGLVRRHSAIAGWSLTAYLKNLHVAGMSWEAIYWHVWAACIVMRPSRSSVHHRRSNKGVNGAGHIPSSIMISALEVDRYYLESAELHIYSRPKPPGKSIEEFKAQVTDELVGKTVAFSLNCEYDNTLGVEIYRMYPRSDFNLSASSHNNGNGATGALAAEFSALGISLSSLHGHGGVTPTLSPLRPPEVLTDEIFDLLRSQARFLEGGQHRQLLDATAHSVVASSAAIPPFIPNHTQPSVPPPSRAVGGIAAVYGNGNLHNKQSPASTHPPQYPQKPNNYTNFSALLWGEADARARQKMQNKLPRKSYPGGGGGTMSSSSNDPEKNENGVNHSDRGTNDDRSAAMLRAVAGGSKEGKDRGRSRSGSRSRKQQSKSANGRPSTGRAGGTNKSSVNGGRRKRAPSASSAGSSNARNDPQSDGDIHVVQSASNDIDGDTEIAVDPDGLLLDNRDSDNSDLDIDEAARLAIAGVDVIGGIRSRKFDGSGGTKLRRAQRRKAKAIHDVRDDGIPVLPPAGPSGPSHDKGQGHRIVPEVLSAVAMKDLLTLTALSPEAEKLAESGRGSVRGVWLTEHPLQIQPVTFLEAIQKISEPSSRNISLGLSAEKQLLWKLDLLRQHDEHCMGRYEAFLAHKRNPTGEEQIKSRAKLVGANPLATFSANLIAQQQQILMQQQQQQSTRGTTRRKEAANAINMANFEYYKDHGRAPVR